MKAFSVRVNFTWSLLGSIVLSATNWAMQIVLAKLGTPEIVGKYALGVAITQPIFGFAQLQLRNVQATDAKGEYTFQQFLALRWLCVGVAMSVVAALAFWGNPIETAWVVLLTGVGLIFDSTADIIYGLLQRHERLDFVGRSMTMRGILNVACLGLCFYATHNIIIAMIGSVASSILVLTFYDRRIAKRILQFENASARVSPLLMPHGAPIDWNGVRRLGFLALPLGITLLLLNLTGNTSRYFIDHYCGERAFGIFSALSALIVLGRTIVTALAQAITPRLAKAFKGGNLGRFRRDMGLFCLATFIVGAVVPLGVWIGGPTLIAKIYTRDYSHDFYALLVLLASGAVSYVVSCVGFGLTAAGIYRVQVTWFGASAFAAVGFSWWLVPHYGLIGAAYASLAVALVQLVIGAGLLLSAVAVEQRKLKAMDQFVAPMVELPADKYEVKL